MSICIKSLIKRHGYVSCGETGNTAGKKTVKLKANIMGDKSPKAVNKHATQKQTKADSSQQKKQQAIAAKQSAIKKK